MDNVWFEENEKIGKIEDMSLSQIVRIADSFKMPYKFQRKGFVGLVVDLSAQVFLMKELSQFR